MNRMFLRSVKCFPLIGQFLFLWRGQTKWKKNDIPNENEWKCLEQIFMWATVVSILFVYFFLSLALTLTWLSISAPRFSLSLSLVLSFCCSRFRSLNEKSPSLTTAWIISLTKPQISHVHCMDSSKEMTKPMEKKASFWNWFFFLSFAFSRCVEFPFFNFCASNSNTKKSPFP